MNKRRYIVVSHSCGTSTKDDPYTELAVAVLMQAVDGLYRSAENAFERRSCEK